MIKVWDKVKIRSDLQVWDYERIDWAVRASNKMVERAWEVVIIKYIAGNWIFLISNDGWCRNRTETMFESKTFRFIS